MKIPCATVKVRRRHGASVLEAFRSCAVFEHPKEGELWVMFGSADRKDRARFDLQKSLQGVFDIGTPGTSVVVYESPRGKTRHVLVEAIRASALEQDEAIEIVQGE